MATHFIAPRTASLAGPFRLYGHWLNSFTVTGSFYNSIYVKMMHATIYAVNFPFTIPAFRSVHHLLVSFEAEPAFDAHARHLFIDDITHILPAESGWSDIDFDDGSLLVNKFLSAEH